MQKREVINRLQGMEYALAQQSTCGVDTRLNKAQTSRVSSVFHKHAI